MLRRNVCWQEGGVGGEKEEREGRREGEREKWRGRKKKWRKREGRRKGGRRKEERKREGQMQYCTGCCFKKQSLASVRTPTKWGSVLSCVCSAPVHLIVWPWLWWNLFLKETGKHEPWCFNRKASSKVINDPEVGFGSRGDYFLRCPQRCQEQLRSLKREKGAWKEDGMSGKDRKKCVRWCHGRENRSCWVLCL